MSEVQSVFLITQFHVRSPIRLLDYTVPCQKSSPSFRLYGSVSEVQSVSQIIRFHFRSPVRLEMTQYTSTTVGAEDIASYFISLLIIIIIIIIIIILFVCKV